MNYTTEVEINLPRARVIELFDSEENQLKWQPNLKSLQHLSGETGQPGASARMIVAMGDKDVEMVETITVRNFPDEFCGIYETKGIWNEVKNTFREITPDKTVWHLHAGFRFKGHRLMRIRAWSMKL